MAKISSALAQTREELSTANSSVAELRSQLEEVTQTIAQFEEAANVAVASETEAKKALEELKVSLCHSGPLFAFWR